MTVRNVSLSYKSLVELKCELQINFFAFFPIDIASLLRDVSTIQDDAISIMIRSYI